MKSLLKSSGFSLVEIILALVILGIFSSVASIAFQPVLDSWSLSGPKAEVTQSTLYAVNRMKSEITRIKNAQSIIEATATAFEFTDVDDTTIRYALSGGNLLRNSDILTRGVTGLTFNYWDDTNASLTTPVVAPSDTDIWRIEIKINAAVNGQDLTLATQVHPRNLPRS